MTLTDRLPFVGSDEPEVGAFLDRAAVWATELTYEEIPPPVRRAAKAQFTSTVGAAVWTRSHPIGGSVVETVTEGDDGGSATLVGGERLSPAGAARGNAALSMAQIGRAHV